jgi:DHA1 family bicyclomycin/chloramphenicol resistance-like MFS transporter
VTSPHTPPAQTLQAHPSRWLAVTVALLAMLAPFSIDTYLPSFPDIAREFAVSSLYLQQTLSLYLLAFAVMTLVYGPLSDTYGRRRVVLAAVGLYVASSVGCWFAPSAHWLLAMRVGQGLSASAGIVIGRAVIRDAFAGPQAQRVMANMMLIFALAPAVAPIIGGWLHDAFGWRSVFVFLTLLGTTLWTWTARVLPETLPAVARQPIHPRAVGRTYWRALRSGHFMGLVFVTALNFGGLFLYIAGSPEIVYRHLDLGPNGFGVLFVPLVAGMMTGAFLSGRLAGRVTHAHCVDLGYALMLGAAALNVVLALSVPANLYTVIAPPMLYASGMALAMPNLTLMAIDLFPAHRGLASALQGFTHTASNAVVAGVVVALLAHDLRWLTAGMFGFALSGFVWWRLACRHHALPPSATQA